MRRIGRIGAHVLAGLTAIVVGLPMSSDGADSARRGSDLDSRTVPHPEWAQISGQIEQTSTVQSKMGTPLCAPDTAYGRRPCDRRFRDRCRRQLPAKTGRLYPCPR